jgi:diguanylate cyclase (GGDEF)-like protein
MSTIEEMLQGNVRLPSPPAIAIRLLEVVKKDQFDLADLAKIIQADPALTARVLKLANSSLYFLPKKVSSIKRALNVLGADTLKNIALSFVIFSGLKGQRGGRFDFDFFWKRSITAAVAAGQIASFVNYKDGDIFIKALLQDIGIIILYLCRADDYLKVFDEKNISDLPVQVVEKQVFGFDHQELGSDVLKNWGLPENIYLPVRYHHTIEKVPDRWRTQVAILFLSDRISSIYHGTLSGEKFRETKTLLSQRLGIKEADVEPLIDAVAHKSVEILSDFEIDPRSVRPFSQILQEANEQLSSLNTSYEMLVIELKQAKEKAERLAGELRNANEALRKLAFRDSLTDLYNHRAFQDLLDQEVSRSQRYNRWLALIMVDIDHFKKINDAYGHPRGDLVLQAVGSILRGIGRASDIVARHGGEEFAMVLPETDLNGAIAMAERCRKAIEQTSVQADNQIIRVTASFGVTSYAPEVGSFGKAAIIDAADKALYNSKTSGRNKVSLVKIGGA